MSPEQIEATIAQTFLKAEKTYTGPLDGIWGDQSRAAVKAWLILTGWRWLPKDEATMRALAAQSLLAKLGFYQGPIDGDWGAASRAAADNWSRYAPPAAAPPPVARQYNDPYSVALGFLHTKEMPGKQNNPVIVGWLRRLAIWVNDDETAWCSAFVNAMAERASYERSGKLNARSWLDVGQPVNLQDARKGDVIILWRGSKDAWTGHVAFLDHYNPTRELLYLLGGNQSDEVNITAYPVGKLLGIRRLRSLASQQGYAPGRLL